jgi:integrase
MENGKVFNAEGYNKQVWGKAVKASGVSYRKPYTSRHTFAAWALTIRIDSNRLVDFMGHASKQIIYEVYGKYTKGLDKDRIAILRYFGKDFKMSR